MQRNHAIDIEKGIAILLVILGHVSLTPAGLKIWLYSFHMPLFFACSGMVLSTDRYNTITDFVKRKTQTIIIPYFALGTSLWILSNAYYSFANRIMASGYDVDWNILHLATGLILGNRLHEQYFSLWFLTALYVSEIISFVILLKFKDSINWILSISVVCIIIQFFVSKTVHGFYWSLDLVPSGVAFLLLGYSVNKRIHSNRIKLNGFIVIGFFFIINAIFCALNYKAFGRTDLYECNIGNPLYFAFSAITGIMFIVVVCEKLKVSPLTEYFGRNSLIIYAFQNRLSIPIAKDSVSVLGTKSSLLQDNTLQWIMIITITMIISCALIELINRYCPFIIGKKMLLKCSKRNAV